MFKCHVKKGDEVVVIAGAVAVLEAVLLEVGALDLVLRAETVLGVGAGLDVDQPGLHHAPPVAGGDVLGGHDPVQIVVVLDAHPALELRRLNH